MKDPLNRDKEIITFTGKYINVFEPKIEEIDIKDIAHALSLQVRFTGHIKCHYSIAQHSLFVSTHLPFKYKLSGLLHDAAEAYLSDISSPQKHNMDQFKEIEHNLMLVISTKFNFVYPLDDEVKLVDKQALEWEFYNLVYPKRLSIKFWYYYLIPPFVIEKLFLKRFKLLSNQK